MNDIPTNKYLIKLAQLANALMDAGIKKGDRVFLFAWLTAQNTLLH